MNNFHWRLTSFMHSVRTPSNVLILHQCKLFYKFIHIKATSALVSSIIEMMTSWPLPLVPEAEWWRPVNPLIMTASWPWTWWPVILHSPAVVHSFCIVKWSLQFSGCHTTRLICVTIYISSNLPPSHYHKGMTKRLNVAILYRELRHSVNRGKLDDISP